MLYADMEFRARVAKRLRRRRIALGLTAADLAKRAGLTRTIIINFESGRNGISIDVYNTWARALSIDPDFIMRPDDCQVCEGFPPPGFRCQGCGQSKVLDVTCAVCQDKPPAGMTCEACEASTP